MKKTKLHSSDECAHATREYAKLSAHSAPSAHSASPNSPSSSFSLDPRRNPYLAGLLASLAMLGFYFGLLSILNSPQHAWTNFLQLAPFLLAISAGLGIQVGLMVFISIRARERASQGAVMASGGVSAGAMAACCAHHATDLLAFAGLSALAALLYKYQFLLLLLGLFSNVLGIVWMLGHIQTHRLLPPQSSWQMVMKIDYKSIFAPLLVVLAALWLAYGLQIIFGSRMLYG